jgi:hypothetical protein
MHPHTQVPALSPRLASVGQLSQASADFPSKGIARSETCPQQVQVKTNYGGVQTTQDTCRQAGSSVKIACKALCTLHTTCHRAVCTRGARLGTAQHSTTRHDSAHQTGAQTHLSRPKTSFMCLSPNRKALECHTPCSPAPCSPAPDQTLHIPLSPTKPHPPLFFFGFFSHVYWRGTPPGWS